MPGGHEILTLQFGGYANYVGSHYWNIQDEILGLQGSDQRGSYEIDCDVLYREGQTHKGDSTYTPRLVSFDVKGCLGAIPIQGALYSSTSETASQTPTTWSGRHVVHRAAPVNKTAFQEQLDIEYESLESTLQLNNQAADAGPSPLEIAAGSLDSPGAVRYFTDYLKAYIHPRSNCLLPGTWQPPLEASNISSGGSSSGLWTEYRTSEVREDAAERVRLFAEECDALRGFQCIVQDTPEWGGLAHQTLEDLRDEYANKTVLLFAVRPPSKNDSHSIAPSVKQRTSIDRGLFIASLSQCSDVYVPLSAPHGGRAAGLPGLRWRSGSWFHESALCAVALDSITLPYRLAATTDASGPVGRLDPWALAQLISGQRGVNIAAVQLGMPCSALPSDPLLEAQLADARTSTHDSSNTATDTGTSERRTNEIPDLVSSVASLTHGMASGRDPNLLAECVVLRGARRSGQLASLTTASQELDESLLREGVRAVRHRVVGLQPVPIPLPFPKLFGAIVSRYGDVLSTTSSSNSPVDVASCPVLTRLSSTRALKPVLQEAQRDVARAWSSAVGQSVSDGWELGREEQGEMGEELLRMVHAYDDDAED